MAKGISLSPDHARPKLTNSVIAFAEGASILLTLPWAYPHDNWPGRAFPPKGTYVLYIYHLHLSLASITCKLHLSLANCFCTFFSAGFLGLWRVWWTPSPCKVCVVRIAIWRAVKAACDVQAKGIVTTQCNQSRFHVPRRIWDMLFGAPCKVDNHHVVLDLARTLGMKKNNSFLRDSLGPPAHIPINTASGMGPLMFNA